MRQTNKRTVHGTLGYFSIIKEESETGTSHYLELEDYDGETISVIFSKEEIDSIAAMFGEF